MSANSYTVLRDGQGRVYMIMGDKDAFPTGYGAGIPQNTLGWDTTEAKWYYFTDVNTWSALVITNSVNASVTGNVTGNVTGDVTGQVVHNDNVRSKRVRVTLGQLNAGHTLLPAVAGYGYRIIGFNMIAIGGALGTATSIEIECDSADLFSVAAAQLTQSAVNTEDGAGTTVLADGASFDVNADNKAVKMSATGTADTLTHVDVILTYTLET